MEVRLGVEGREGEERFKKKSDGWVRRSGEEGGGEEEGEEGGLQGRRGVYKGRREEGVWFEGVGQKGEGYKGRRSRFQEEGYKGRGGEGRVLKGVTG